MKPGRLELHLKSKYRAYVNSDLNYFKSLNKKFANRSTIKSLFNTQTVSVNRTLEASNKISSLIAKCGKNHTIGEGLIKPSISAYLKTILEKDDDAIKAMPLSNNTLSRRIDEMSDDIETQLVLKS
ncbi:SCAN domain-containing protein 3 [Trichonephila clavipes]|nr:SCAN domain-containing protein 3 [Trichonephila clavipes]